MKGKICKEKVYEGVMDSFRGGGGHNVIRLVVEDADGLAITPGYNQVYAMTGFDAERPEVTLLVTGHG